MNTGSLVALCLAALFASVVVPWSAAVAYRRQRTPKTPKKPKKVVENANGYRRYGEYTFLIFGWAVAITTYIAVLDRAVLSFVRTGLAVIHLPLMTTVLAATVPYWTMAKFDRRSVPETAASRPTHPLDDFPPPTKVTKLFYLADKTWSGLIGWVQTFIYGYNEGGFSYTWTLLAMVAALSYIGFPLLSVAYVTTSTQYWVSGNMPATVRLGGLDSFLNTTLNPNLTGFNSSSAGGTTYSGIANQTIFFPWADNQTVFTLSPNTAENKQLPLAGIRAFASCALNNYSILTGSGNESMLALNLEIDNVNPDNNGGFPYELRCGNNCSDLGTSTALACSAQSSIINITQFDYKDQSGYLDGNMNNYASHDSFNYVGSTFQGQALSCVEQEYNSLQSVATIVLAIPVSNTSTQVANCNISVTYLRPTVNTLIGSYIESTGSSSPDIVLDADPVELLNLSIASFVNFFHKGPPPLTFQPVNNAPVDNCTLPPISSGFTWISNWGPPCGSSPDGPPVSNETTPAALLTGPNNYADFVTAVSSFDERVFLGPLASLINDKSFFQNGTIAGVTFKTEQGLSYGRVPPLLAVLILGIPLLCTIALSVITTIQRRWTASLDAFSMFKLGADWRSNVETQRLVSLGKASSHVKDIPGTVVVNPETGVVELAHPPKRRRLSRNSHRPGWLMDYTAVETSAP